MRLQMQIPHLPRGPVQWQLCVSLQAMMTLRGKFSLCDRYLGNYPFTKVAHIGDRAAKVQLTLFVGIDFFTRLVLMNFFYRINRK